MLRLTTSSGLVLCAYIIVSVATQFKSGHCDELHSKPSESHIVFESTKPNTTTECQDSSCQELPSDNASQPSVTAECDGEHCSKAHFDPCSSVSCGENAFCLSFQEEPFCACAPGHYGDPYKKCMEVECQMNSDCISEETCASGKCVDACTSLMKCGENANCSVVDHRPFCTCPQGYAGDPYKLCRISECIDNSGCHVGKTCFSGQCVDPCSTEMKCGFNAACQVRDHLHSCACLEGYIGNPYQMCIIPDCASDNDCSSNRTCTFSRCVDPCVTMILRCGANTVCQATNHRPSCACVPGHSGDPFQGCTVGTITGNSSHPSSPSSKSNRYHAETSFKTDWQGALQHCQSQGRRLATVQSWEDNNHILQVIGQTNIRSGHFWTAGTDQYGTGWIWETTRRPFTFTYWNVLQPTNYIMRNEHCMGYWEISTVIAKGYKWNDRDCKYNGYFICEDFKNMQ